MENDSIKATIRALSDRVVTAQKEVRVLNAIKWDDSVREEFFAADCREQPAVDAHYYQRVPLGFDHGQLTETFRKIDHDIVAQLGKFNPAAKIMRRMCHEYQLVLAMLAARGTPEFSRISQELYGRSTDAFHVGEPNLVDMAASLDNSLRIIDEHLFLEQNARDIPTEQAVGMLQARLDGFFSDPGSRIKVRISDGIVADAAAGSDYIKLRKDAFFSERDLRVLEVHEGWVHAGTTLNGRAQPVCTFLEKGTPSMTITQEGLALLVEIISFSSHPARLRRVTDRIRAIHSAEQGGTFLDVFNMLCGEGRSREDAYTTTMRVFRGSLPEGPPFTKDLAYSKGFIHIYNFIRVAVRRGRLDRIPLLFCGKLTLEDIGSIAELVEQGLVVQPRYLPLPFQDLNALTAWMAYSNFLNKLDLAKVEADFAQLF